MHRITTAESHSRAHGGRSLTFGRGPGCWLCTPGRAGPVTPLSRTPFHTHSRPPLPHSKRRKPPGAPAAVRVYLLRKGNRLVQTYRFVYVGLRKMQVKGLSLPGLWMGPSQGTARYTGAQEAQSGPCTVNSRHRCRRASVISGRPHVIPTRPVLWQQFYQREAAASRKCEQMTLPGF